jgi:SAM-dependent methyltransferase
LDLGCGGGPLLLALAANPFFARIVGLDISRKALEDCARHLRHAGLQSDPRIQLRNGSFTEANPDLAGYDAAVLLETIEHIRPDRLSKVERAVFNSYRPRLVLITTPNQECNELLGVPATARAIRATNSNGQERNSKPGPAAWPAATIIRWNFPASARPIPCWARRAKWRCLTVWKLDGAGLLAASLRPLIGRTGNGTERCHADDILGPGLYRRGGAGRADL